MIKLYIMKRLLTERESGGSLDFKPYLNLLTKKGFNIDSVGKNSMRIWYNEDDVNTKAEYLFKLAKHCGWVCTSYGNYYDGLRSQAERIASKNNIEKYGIYIFNIEKEFPNETNYDFSDVMIDNDWNEQKEHDNAFDVNYTPNVLYHITKRKYLKRILKYGLLPKNSHEITNWRDTGNRLYLSLLPEFDKIDATDDYEPEDDDDILLKVNIAPIRNKIKFYQDYAYDNAVFTTSIIPPNLISVVSNDEINVMDFKYELYRYMPKNMDTIKKANKEYSIKTLINNYDWYIKNTLKKLYPTNSFIRQINNTTLDNILTDAIKDYAKKYL